MAGSIILIVMNAHTQKNMGKAQVRSESEKGPGTSHPKRCEIDGVTRPLISSTQAQG